MRNFLGSRSINAIVALLSFVSVSAVAAPAKEADPVRELRHHMQVLAKDGTLLYHVTVIDLWSDAKDATTVLVRDEGLGDFVMRRIWTFESQTVTYRISDVSDKSFVQQSFRTPFASKNRKETLSEARENESVRQAGVIINIETNGGKWEGAETDWDEFIQMRRLRYDQRMTMNSSLLEALERMRGTFFTTEPGYLFLRQVARYILYDADSAEIAPSANVKVTEAEPHCEFDSSFGFPCSDAQLARIAKAAKDGKELRRY